MFPFFLKKTRLRTALFASLFPVLLSGLLFVSCDQPTDSVVNAKPPSITVQPSGGTWNVDTEDTFPLTVTASSPDGGTLSHQWYRNTVNSNSGGSPIGNNATLTLAKANHLYNEDCYFYAVVTNTITNNGDGGEKTADTVSDVVKVTVSGNLVNARPPTISVQPQGGMWEIDKEDEFTLTVTADVTDGGTPSFQWYKAENANSTSGEEIDGETDETLTLDKNDYEAGDTLYFYVVVTNTITDNGDGGQKTMAETSSVATVTVTDNTKVTPTVNAAAPNITTQPAATGTWSNAAGSTHTRTVAAASTDGGTISFQWYSNTSNSNTGGSVLSGQTSAALTLQSASYPTAGTYYFYAVVTNTNNNVNGNKTATAASNVAAVTVTIPAPANAAAPTISAQPVGATWNVNTDPATLSSINPKVTANSADGGTLTYQWYRNTANSNSGGTLISGQTGATLSLTSIRSAYLSSGNGTRYVYVVVTNTNNNATGNKTAATTSSAAAIVMQGIVPFGSVAAWPSGRHDPGSANFTTIIQCVEGYFPSQWGDNYNVRRFGDLTATERTRLGMAASGTVQTLGGVTVTANDYIYGQQSSSGYSGVIRAINIFSEAGASTTNWRGVFVVEFIAKPNWGVPANNNFHGYYFGFPSQDEISSIQNSGGDFSYTASIAGVVSAFTWASRASITGFSNLYGGGWYRPPRTADSPWPTN